MEEKATSYECRCKTFPNLSGKLGKKNDKIMAYQMMKEMMERFMQTMMRFIQEECLIPRNMQLPIRTMINTDKKSQDRNVDCPCKKPGKLSPIISKKAIKYPLQPLARAAADIEYSIVKFHPILFLCEAEAKIILTANQLVLRLRHKQRYTPILREESVC